MKLLINGASMSATRDSWPYRLQERLNCDMVNLAVPAVGNTYIHETTISEIANNQYDLVIIMWASSAHRADWRVGDITKFADTDWTSRHMSQVKNWPNNKDLDYIQPDWVLSSGYLNAQQDKIPLVDRSKASLLFTDYYSVVKSHQFIFHDLIKVISLQGVLKSMNIPYIFIDAEPEIRYAAYPELCSLIDHDNYYADVYLKKICKENNWLSEEFEGYPNERGSCEFADLLQQHLIKKNYVKK